MRLPRATLAQKAHDSWAKLKAAKMMAKEAVQDKYTATHKASCRVLVACWSFEARALFPTHVPFPLFFKFIVTKASRQARQGAGKGGSCRENMSNFNLIV